MFNNILFINKTRHYPRAQESVFNFNYLLRRKLREKNAYSAIIVIANISRKKFRRGRKSLFLSLVTTKVIKHRVNGEDPCEQRRRKALLPFDKHGRDYGRHYGCEEQHGVNVPFVNRSLTLKAGSVVRDCIHLRFSHMFLHMHRRSLSATVPGQTIFLLPEIYDYSYEF